VRYRLSRRPRTVLAVTEGALSDSADASRRACSTTDYDTAVSIARGRENAQLALSHVPSDSGGNIETLVRSAAALVRSTTPPRRSATRPPTRAVRIRDHVRRSHPCELPVLGYSPPPHTIRLACRRRRRVGPGSRLSTHRWSSRAAGPRTPPRRRVSLWWVFCRILAAADAVDSAYASRAGVWRLSHRRPPGRTLPFRRRRAMSLRHRLLAPSTTRSSNVSTSTLVRGTVDGDDPLRLRRRRSEHRCGFVYELDPALAHAGPDCCLGHGDRSGTRPPPPPVPLVAVAALDTIGRERGVVFVGGVGSRLPARFYGHDRLVVATGRRIRGDLAPTFDRIAVRAGLEPAVVPRPIAPVVPELLRPAQRNRISPSGVICQ